MKKKNGFVFIETIITIVVLTTTLLFLYSSYYKTITSEKYRLYYDDIAYVYKTVYIRDILDRTLDLEKFETEKNLSLDNGTDSRYIYFFNVDSDIYRNAAKEENTDGKYNSLIKNARTLYNFAVLAYINKNKIGDLKKCIRNNTNTDICKNTLTDLKGYSYSNISDYLLSISVDNNPDSEGILVAIYYEAKNGDVKRSESSYQKCLQEKAKVLYETTCKNSTCKNVSAATDARDKCILKCVMDKYNANQNINYNMQCENAYYIAWVWL